MPVLRVGFEETDAPAAVPGVVRLFADSADHHVKAKLPDGSVIDLCEGGAPSAPVWGGIIGTLANQTDLQNALNAKNAITIEGTSGTTHSLTTAAGDIVLVMVKGDWTGSSSAATITLAYNSIAQDSVGVKQAATADKLPFYLQYFATPGARTANITVSASGGSLANVKIIVVKVKV